MPDNLFRQTKPVVISLCDRSGVMVRPWAEAGFECICVDLQHKKRSDRTEGNITFTYGDIRSWEIPAHVRGHLVMLFAFIPCTDVTVADARDFMKKGPMLLWDSLVMFNAARQAGRWAGVPWMIENPVGMFSSYIGKPDYTFQPYEFGDLWTKRTCLWTGNGFIMPQPVHTAEPEGVTQRIWKMPPSDNRADLRSETPPGFARAVFEANADVVLQRYRAA
jgi:hypothetical protein